MKPDLMTMFKGQIVTRGAYIFFSQGAGRNKESVYYNPEAWRIFSYASFDEKGVSQKSAFPNIGKLCTQWKKSLDEQIDPKKEKKEEDLSQFIDIYQSKERRYLVRGILLSGYTPGNDSTTHSTSQYLFLLERITPDRINLPMIARIWRLNPREMGIVQFLILDRSNKEIARLLKISINTLKGYLKLLMRKLGVGSRAGIVARVLTGKAPSGAE